MTTRRSQFVGYADFTNDLHISYVDYLQGRQFEESIRYAIREQTKDIIASNTQLAKAKLQVEERTKESIDRGFAVISCDLESIREVLQDDLHELNATFEWGFTEVLFSLGRLNDSLAELVRIAKTPAQTWAFEQFDIARDEFRRSLYPEALESINRAIAGYGANPGYKSEFRFHFLLGTLRLGSFANCSTEIVNLDQAETAFLNASRYAQHDNPIDASNALLGASRAAFANNKLAQTRAYLETALKLHDAGEIRYQLARTLCALNNWSAASDHLDEAIMFDKMYAIKAGGEAEFQRFPSELDRLLSQLRDRAKAVLADEIASFEKLSAELRSIRVDRYSMAEHGKDGLALLDSKLADARSAASSNTYFGYLEAVGLLSNTYFGYLEAVGLLSKSGDYRAQAINDFKNSARTDIGRRITAAQGTVYAATQKRSKNREIFGPAFGITFAIMELGAILAAWENASKYSHVVEFAIVFIFSAALYSGLSALTAVVVGFIVSILSAPVIGLQNMALGSEISSGEETISELRSIGGKIEALR